MLRDSGDAPGGRPHDTANSDNHGCTETPNPHDPRLVPYEPRRTRGTGGVDDPSCIASNRRLHASPLVLRTRHHIRRRPERLLRLAISLIGGAPTGLRRSLPVHHGSLRGMVQRQDTRRRSRMRDVTRQRSRLSFRLGTTSRGGRYRRSLRPGTRHGHAIRSSGGLRRATFGASVAVRVENAQPFVGFCTVTGLDVQVVMPADRVRGLTRRQHARAHAASPP